MEIKTPNFNIKKEERKEKEVTVNHYDMRHAYYNITGSVILSANNKLMVSGA